MLAGDAQKSFTLAAIFASICCNSAWSSGYKEKYFSIRPGMTPQELEMHSIKPSHAYCKEGGDKETVLRRDGEYQFDYDQRGILTNTTWSLRHKLGYKSNFNFRLMAMNSLCLKNKKFVFDKTNETALEGSKFLFRRKSMFAVYKSDYPIYYDLVPDMQSGKGYFLYCDRRGKMSTTIITDLCAISEVICPYKKSRGGMMGGGSRF